MNRKIFIISEITNLCDKFCNTDRKKCEFLSKTDLKNAINSKQISVEEIVSAFRIELLTSLKLENGKH
mgnify:CR=1 FL=1